MKKITILATVIAVGLVTLQGCAALVPDSYVKAVHQEMDKNNDGYIDYNEFLKSNDLSDEEMAQRAKEKGMTEEEYLKWDFSRADGNRDGKITEQELIELFRKEM
jgi:Ca2+-binding EF-hand superfamily protein